MSVYCILVYLESLASTGDDKFHEDGGIEDEEIFKERERESFLFVIVCCLLFQGSTPRIRAILGLVLLPRLGGEKMECNVGGSYEGCQPATIARNVKVCTRKLYCF